MGDDGAALRGLQGRRGAAFLPGSFCEARPPDRAGRCASAFNSGPEALHDLEAALAGILDCFNVGRASFLSSLFRPRIDRILFAATKADHLHHASHDRLEAVLRRAVTRAVARAESTGTEIDVVALAAVRATREAQVARGRDKLPSILGTPQAGESANGEFFDGETEVATFPGDLPADPEALFGGADAFRGLSTEAAERSDYRFLRFRPPRLEREGNDVRRCLTSALTVPCSS